MPASLPASTVSRQIKAGGVMTSGYTRRFAHEGVYVTQSWANWIVSVHVDIDTPSLRTTVTDRVEEILKERGYAVARKDGKGSATLTVQRP